MLFAIGMIPLMIAYWPLKAAFNPFAFVAVSVLYMVALWLLTTMLVRRLQPPPDSEDLDAPE